MNYPKYKCAVIFVNDIECSKNFYCNVLNQEIEMDFGRNVSFKNGFAIWLKDYAIKTIFNDSKNIENKNNLNIELYFELPDINDFFIKLKNQKIEFIHDIHEHPWGQQAFRIFDPDSYIIEIAESMDDVIKRFFNNGFDISEISKKTLMPIDYIKSIIKDF